MEWGVALAGFLCFAGIAIAIGGGLFGAITLLESGSKWKGLVGALVFTLGLFILSLTLGLL